jgi:hypothetical protein
MKLVLNLPSKLEIALAAEAARLGLPLEEYALRLLAGGPCPHPGPRTGAERLAYWQCEGLVGAQQEIANASQHARALREQARGDA